MVVRLVEKIVDDFRFRYRRHDVKDTDVKRRQNRPSILTTADIQESRNKAPVQETAKEPEQSTAASKQPTQAGAQKNPEPVTYPPNDIDEPLIPLEKLQGGKKTKRVKWRKFLLVSVGLLILTCLVIGGYLVFKTHTQKNSTLSQASDVNNNSESLAIAIKTEVSKYLEDIPTETPTLETVQEPGSGGQGFQDTQRGDKILYFDSVGKAIIYRPTTGKVLVYTYFTTGSGTQNLKDQTPLPDTDQTSSQ